MHRLAVLLSALLLSGTVLAQSVGGRLVISPNYEAPSLDHLTSGTAHDALWSLYDRLVSRDGSGVYQPALASSWDASEDGMVWTFTIRDDVFFHSGDRLTAEAIKWFFDKARDPEGQYAFSSNLAPIESIEVPDDTTVVFRLNSPWPFLLDGVSGSFAGIINPNAYEAAGEDYGISVLDGTGPYRLVSWEPGGQLVAARNEAYAWGPDWLGNSGAPYVETLVWQYYEDAASRLLALEGGQIDIMYGVSAQNLERLQQSGRFEFFEKPRFGGALMFVSFNLEKAPFDDVRIRQAINHAIDKDVILERVFFGLGEVAFGYAPPTTFGHLPNPEAVGYEYSPELAVALFAEAGYERGPDGYLQKDGQRFRVTLHSRSETEYQQTAQILQEQFRAVGLDVSLVLGDFSSYVDAMRAGEHQLNLGLYGWSRIDILQFWFPSRQIPWPNSSRLRDPLVDDLLGVALQGPTLDDSVRNYQRAEQYLIEQAFWAPLVFLMDTIAVSDRVGGFYAHPQDGTHLVEIYVR
jgi:peptide/nickel transport system substrate-binding protein